MLVGEAQNLFSERIRRRKSFFQKTYIFQIRWDDGRTHFRKISRNFPSLYFILIYAAPNIDAVGSYLIRGGRSRHYALTETMKVATYAKHGESENADDVDDDSYWEAQWELMDLADAYWDRFIVK